MLGDYDKCKICGSRGIYEDDICDECRDESEIIQTNAQLGAERWEGRL
jgi:uncharacterized OB-fold protein